jgi:hypothetical protein
MVDSGKQGKCIAFEKLKKFQKILKQLELDKLDKKHVAKKMILDELSNNIKIDKIVEDFFK